MYFSLKKGPQNQVRFEAGIIRQEDKIEMSAYFCGSNARVTNLYNLLKHLRFLFALCNYIKKKNSLLGRVLMVISLVEIFQRSILHLLYLFIDLDMDLLLVPFEIVNKYCEKNGSTSIRIPKSRKLFMLVHSPFIFTAAMY